VAFGMGCSRRTGRHSGRRRSDRLPDQRPHFLRLLQVVRWPDDRPQAAEPDSAAVATGTGRNPGRGCSCRKRCGDVASH